MIVGELRHGQLVIVDRMRETVRLAEGLSERGDLSAAARERALTCLAQFGQRIKDFKADTVRAAGTSTLRRAREDSDFLREAEDAFGHPIEVISGIEEARLIYNGVYHSMPPTEGQRLVMDIGGGSTELILGKGSKTRALESLHLGCVSMTERCFPDGRLTRERFEQARTQARLELRPVKAFFRDPKVEAIGTSGTINSASTVAQALGIIDTSDLTLSAVEALIDRMLAFDTVADIRLSELSDRRAQVWPGGLSILAELLSALRVDRLKVSDGALREGLLYDLVGRLRDEDARERTVRAMASRYHVNKKQVKRVATTSQMLFEQVSKTWFTNTALTANALSWASRLHEIGLDISHDGYQRHGAYIAENADMPGFPRAEQRLLAYLIGNQRRSINRSGLKRLPRSWRRGALRLAVLFRIAVLINRGRSETPHPHIDASATESSLTLTFDPEWLAENPLTLADLKREVGYLRAVGIALKIT